MVIEKFDFSVKCNEKPFINAKQGLTKQDVCSIVTAMDTVEKTLGLGFKVCSETDVIFEDV